MNYSIKEIKKILGGAPWDELLPEDLCMDYLPTWVELYFDDDYCINYGCTKLVIIPPDTDYVIKIPFLTDETCEFCSAIYPIHNLHGWDYCASECEWYYVAAQHGIKDFFAQSEYVFSYNDYIKVYVQEKCKIYNGAGYVKHSKEERFEVLNKLDSIKCRNTPLDLDFLVELFKYYSEAEIQKFLIFTERNLSDLHNANVGFRYGRPVLVDYSGFYD